MSEAAQQTAKVMEIAGTSVAVGSWWVTSLGWLDDHSKAVVALCAIVGVVFSGVGVLMHSVLYYRFKQREFRLRQMEYAEQYLKGRHP